MRNPLSMFRRHQKVLLCVFGVVIIITFTIGGSIEYYQTSRVPSGYETDVVVTWKHGRFREDDLDLMRNLHALTVRFLDTLVMRAVEAGGVPSAPGLTRDQMTGQIRDPGIPRSYAEEDLIQTAILAQRAEEMGVVVSDQAIVEFLDGLAAGKVPRSEFAGLLRDATGGRLIQLQLFEQLRTELRAQNLRMMANSGLLAVTPVSAWSYFNRLNRRIEAEMLPLPVEDFVSQVSQEPTPAEIQELYDEGKDRYPDPYSPKPGFKRPLRIAFQYLKADFEQFLEAEMAKIDDDQVREFYEKNMQDFKVPEPPPTDQPMPDETGETPTEPSQPADPAESSQPSEPVEPTKPAEPSDAAPDLQGPENQPEAEETPPAPETPVGPESPERPSEDESSFLLLRTGGVFVSLTADASAEEQPEEPAGNTDTAQQTEQAEPTVEPASAEAQPAPEAAPMEDAVAGEAAAEVTEPAIEPEAPVQYRPLEEVADEIRRSIARPLAQDAMSEAIKNARNEIDRYFRARVRAKALQDAKRDVAQPAPLDLEALGQKYQLVPGETRLVDALEIEDYELGKAYRFSFAQGQVQSIPFAQLAFQEGIPLFRPDQIRSFEVDVEFLYWKSEEEEAFVPTLDQARDEVINAWKRAQALELAEAEAERLVQAARADKSLRETVGKAFAERVFETGEFSWMTRGSTPTGFGAPTLGRVPGVEGAGHEFMEGVFRLQPGEAGVAVNEPRDTVFVVRLLSQTPDEDKRRQDFLRAGVTFDTFYMAYSDRQQLVLDWYEEIQRQYNVQWKRTPQIPRDEW